MALGSVVGTIKDAVDELNKDGKKVGVCKIKVFRPFPTAELVKYLSKAKYVAVIDKAISLGNEGVLATEVKAIAHKNLKAKIQSFVAGLGGRDITRDMIKLVFARIKKSKGDLEFIK